MIYLWINFCQKMTKTYHQKTLYAVFNFVMLHPVLMNMSLANRNRLKEEDSNCSKKNQKTDKTEDSEAARLATVEGVKQVE